MKKLSLSILLLFLLCLPALGIEVGQGGLGQIVATVCTKDTTPVISNTTQDAYTSLTGNAVGQSFDHGSGNSLYSFELSFHTDSVSCVCSVRLGTSTDLTSGYIQEWAGVSISDAGEWKEFVSSTNPAGGTTYYIGVKEDSGDCKFVHSTSDQIASGTRIGSGTTWAMGSPVATHDYNIKVYRCNP